MNLFDDSLFAHRTQLTQKAKFKCILAATVMRFHHAFLVIIGNEPSAKYKDPTHHHFHHKIISVLADTKISIQNFRKWQDEVIASFNEINWLAVDIAKVGQGSEKRYVDSCCIGRVIDDQGEAIGIFQQTILNATKNINIMSVTMGGMVQNFHNMVKETEYYAAKLHQVEKRVEVSNIFLLW